MGTESDKNLDVFMAQEDDERAFDELLESGKGFRGTPPSEFVKSMRCLKAVTRGE